VKSYKDNGQEIGFTCSARLQEGGLIFSASINEPGSGECIIKFASQYSKAAHNYLASRGLAPMLRQCIQISVDWTVVVMDRSECRLLSNMTLSKAQQEKVRSKVQYIVCMLHEGGFVHGDIRDTNLLVDHGSLVSEDVKVHLIDFDWAGHLGEAKDPIGINCKTVKRPEEVKGGELITKEHDYDMVLICSESQTSPFRQLP